MRRLIRTGALAMLMAFANGVDASAQKAESTWTLNTGGYTTNYFTSLIYAVAESCVKYFAFKESKSDSLWAERIVPDDALVFPVGLQKKGFHGPTDIYGPYHYAFGNPFKHIGDYAIGLDVSCKPSGAILGLYAGAYFKSQEIVYRETDHNLRGFYFQPRVGVVAGGETNAVEAGIFYDVVTGCGGSVPVKDKDMLKGGVGLDFAFSSVDRNGTGKYILQFSMPLHNFLNEEYNGGMLRGVKRKVGYILLTRRVVL